MRIVVAGGTGFIGREVVRHLLQAGTDKVVVTSRHPDRNDPWGGRVEMVQAFAGDPLSMGKAFTGADVVVNCIQFPNHPVEDASKGRTYMEVDGHGTSTAARVAKALGVRRFIYLSGAGAGQGRKERWFQAKDMAEATIRETGMEHAILRPSWIYGPRDRSMNRFAFFCRYLPVVPQIGDGTTAVYPVFVDDVARCVAEAVRREDAKDKVLDLGGPQRLTMDEVVKTLQKVIGQRRPILHHPVGLMKILTIPLTLMPEPILSPGAVDFVTMTVDMDPKPAMEYFGFPFRTLEDGLRTYMR